MKLSDDMLRAIQSADIRLIVYINELAAAAHARMKLAFEHDRRALAQRMRRDRISRRRNVST
jgi:hypothetical protein